MDIGGNQNIEMPQGWDRCKLADFALIIMGQSPPSSTYNSRAIGLPFYQGKKEFGTIYPTPQVYCSAPKKIAEMGDILLSVRAPVGPTNVAPHKSCIGRGLAAIRPLGGIETKFILFSFRNIEPQLSKRGTGTTFKAITKDFLESIQFLLPPLPEQRAIVAKIKELFSKLDKGIESLKRAREQLKVYRQAVLKWAFEGKLTEEWRKTHKVEPAEKLLEKIKEEREKHYQQKIEEWKQAVKEWEANSKQGKKPAKPKKPKEPPPLSKQELAELPKLPDGWVWVKLGDILMVASGKGLNVRKLKGGPYPVYGGNGINGYHSEYMFEDEKLIIGRVGVKCGVIHITEPKSWVTDNALVTYPIVQSFSLRFFKYLLAAKNLHALSGSTAQPVISGSKIYEVAVQFCSLQEQEAIFKEIETRFSVVEKLEQTIDESLNKAEALRQSIMKKAFEGKLLNEQELEAVRNDPEWEPAEKLLEKIKAEKEKMKKQKRTSDRRKKSK